MRSYGWDPTPIRLASFLEEEEILEISLSLSPHVGTEKRSFEDTARGWEFSTRGERALIRHQPYWHLDLILPVSRAVRKEFSVA